MFKAAGIFFAVMFMFGGAIFADSGTSGWTIFKKAQSTRFKGISSVAVVHGDFSGSLYNPALLGVRNQKEIFFVSETGLSEDKLGALLYGMPLKSGMVSGGFAYYDAGNVELNWMDGVELKSETVNAQKDIMGFVSYGRQYSSKLYAGASLKIATSEIAQRKSALAGAVDVGVVYVPVSNMPVSLSVQNVGIATKFVEKENPLPTSVYIGSGYYHTEKKSYFISAGGITSNLSDNTIIPEAGIEYGYDFFSMNVGYRFGVQEAAAHVGIGVHWNNMEFGYAFTPSTYLNPMHRFSISMKLGNLRKS